MHTGKTLFAQLIAVPMYNRSWINGPKRNTAIGAKSGTWRVLEVGSKKLARKSSIKKVKYAY